MPNLTTFLAKIKRSDGRSFKTRTTGHNTRMEAPIQKLIERLAERGFCKKDGKPICKSSWIYLDLDQIVMQYNAVLRGILNYYSFVDNWGNLKYIQYILQQSALHTFCRKLQRRKPMIYKKFGTSLNVPIGDKDKVRRTVCLQLNSNWKKNRMRFHQGINADKLQIQRTLRSRSKLEEDCCICGETENIVMHHVRHIRKSKTKGFARVMSKLNRKQIPVCDQCHCNIHGGTYDGLKLGDFTSLEVAKR